MTRQSNHQYLPACPTMASNPRQYALNVRQQPIQARTSTNNERDRRPIDPPPIIQISLTNPSSPQETHNLCHPTEDDEIYTPTHNALSGQTVSSMFKLNDIDNQVNTFFIFGDLSVKVEGSYRLKLSLFQITDSGAVCLSSIYTLPFTVYSTKNFPGPLDSTFLSKTFSDQGARIKIRKDNRAQAIANLCKRKPSCVSPSIHERRNSVTSHDTQSSAEQSPIMIHPPLPYFRVTLPPPSSAFDKNDSVSFYPSLFDDSTLRLPPIWNLSKRVKTTHEQDAVVAMMQLSQPHPVYSLHTL
ncbi:hypothetical protein G6F60_009525 [Rhizopus arrhizus]|nr:hypothetical protein G6F60_009525 [Rhizopus arrhizus]